MLDYSTNLHGENSCMQVIRRFNDYPNHGYTIDLIGNSSCCSLGLHCDAILHSLFPVFPAKQLFFCTAGMKQFQQNGA